jgi:hypothetical protein
MDESVDRVAVRRNTRRMVLAVVVGTMVAVVVGTLVGWDRHDSVGGYVLALALPLLVVLVVAAVMMWLVSRSSLGRLMQYGGSERRKVFKAVRSGRPLTGRETQIAEAQVESVRRTRWTVWLQGAVAVLLVVEGILSHHPLGWFLFAVGVLNLVLVPFQVWQRRRTVARYRAALAE